MKKHSRLRKLLVRCTTVAKRCRLSIGKRHEVLSCPISQAQHHAPLILRFYIPQHISDDHDLTFVFAYIMPYHHLNMRCTVQPTQEEIPSDCFVVRRLYCGEKLLFQEYLTIQEVDVEGVKIVAVPIPELGVQG